MPLANGRAVKVLFCNLCDGTPGKVLDKDTSISRSLTSECCGSKLSSEQIAAVSDGKLDFRAGKWIEK